MALLVKDDVGRDRPRAQTFRVAGGGATVVDKITRAAPLRCAWHFCGLEFDHLRHS